MTQNTSSAVMAQRIEPHDSLDDFPTPPWAVRALCEALRRDGHALGSVWEPACNRGAMAATLDEYFDSVRKSDVHDYGVLAGVQDFLWPSDCRADWIITNPPFRPGQQFVETALDRARHGVAMLVRTSFLEGQDRHEQLFSRRPPSVVYQFSQRVLMLKGRLVRVGDIDPKSGRPASTATSYCWLVWWRSQPVEWAFDTRLRWIPPCRVRLERPGDYELVHAPR